MDVIREARQQIENATVAFDHGLYLGKRNGPSNKALTLYFLKDEAAVTQLQLSENCSSK